MDFEDFSFEHDYVELMNSFANLYPSSSGRIRSLGPNAGKLDPEDRHFMMKFLQLKYSIIYLQVRTNNNDRKSSFKRLFRNEKSSESTVFMVAGAYLTVLLILASDVVTQLTLLINRVGSSPLATTVSTTPCTERDVKLASAKNIGSQVVSKSPLVKSKFMNREKSAKNSRLM